MGNYLNQDGKKFYEITHSDIYVDKTELLTYTNSVLQTLQKYKIGRASCRERV